MNNILRDGPSVKVKIKLKNKQIDTHTTTPTQGVAGAPPHAVMASVSSISSVFTPDVATPELPESTTLRMSTSFRHSAMFVQRLTANDQEKPSCRLS